MMIKRNKTTRRSKNRRGAAVTELAVCLPVLVLLAVGTISANSMIYFKQSLKITAYEGARVSLIPESTNATVIAQCEELITQRRLQNASVAISTDVASAEEGDLITVSVEAPAGDNGFLTSFFFAGQIYTESVTMMKEN